LRRFLPRAALAAALTLLIALFTPPGDRASHAAADATAAFAKVSEWGSGYEGKVTITNGTSTAINGWEVAFDLPSGSSLGAYWNALHSGDGARHTFRNRDYNATVAPGAAVSFGFVVSGSGVPTACTLNGSSCEGGGQPGAPGTPGTPTVTDRTDSSLSLRWTAASGTVTGYRVYEGATVRATVTDTSATIGDLGTCSSHTYTVKAHNDAGESAASGPVSATTTGCTTPNPGMKAAPYLYLGWGNPPPATTVMNATGIKWFTMAFILSGGGCTPSWDSQRPLKGGVDERNVDAVRAAGGDIMPSIGGWSGNKLGPNCSTPQALAGAYQQVIDAYKLKAIDIDIENTDEFENATVMDRILGALKIVKQNNPGITTILTFPTLSNGPNSHGVRLITRAAELGANVDVFTIMPFNFGGGSDMYQATVNSSEGLKARLKTAFSWDDATAYAHMGISGMNGLSDQREPTTPETWTRIRDWAKARNLARFTYWAVNRDRSGGSGVPQQDWEFTKITAGF
jgi:Cellulose binding domain/Glycosyl hydrolases family 18/Fibronectin type III domain